MKKVLALLLALVLVLSLAACGGSKESQAVSSKESQTDTNKESQTEIDAEKFVIGRWERTRVATFDNQNNFSKGDTLKDTLVFFKDYSRLVITNASQHNTVIGDYNYEWVIEDGFVKQKSKVKAGEDVFSYQIDFNNETLTSVGNSSDVYHKVSDDPDYYLN